MSAKKKYHINPETGRPNQCTATVRGCKYAQGDLIPEHYDTKEEAQAAYEKKMSEEQGQTKALKKPVKKKPVNQGSKLKKGAKTTGSKLPDYWDDEDTRSTDEILTDSAIERLFQGNYNGTLVDEYEYNDAIEFREGQWYHPTPDEPYHGGDRHYIVDPSMEVVDKQAFAQQTIVDVINDEYSNVKLPKGYKITELSDEAMEKLDEVGFFSGYNYEAEIGGSYYGDEFYGFSLEESVRNGSINIVVEDIVKQNTKKDDED